MISLDLMKSSEVRKAGDRSNYQKKSIIFLVVTKQFIISVMLITGSNDQGHITYEIKQMHTKGGGESFLG